MMKLAEIMNIFLIANALLKTPDFYNSLRHMSTVRFLKQLAATIRLLKLIPGRRRCPWWGRRGRWSARERWGRQCTGACATRAGHCSGSGCLRTPLAIFVENRNSFFGRSFLVIEMAFLQIYLHDYFFSSLLSQLQNLQKK